MKAMNTYRLTPVLCYDKRSNSQYLVRWKIQRRILAWWHDYTERGEVVYFEAYELEALKKVLAQASALPIEIIN